MLDEILLKLRLLSMTILKNVGKFPNAFATNLILIDNTIKAN